MRITHFAPFAPGRCGLYESAADMLAMERRLGHQAEFVDVGVEGKRQVGATDRGITTVDYDDVRDYDVFVSHSDMLSAYLASTRAPVVHVLHGRPRSSFLLQQRKPLVSPVYDLVARWAKDERYSFLTLWRSHVPYWRALIPASKLRATSAPPCDLERFDPAGPSYDFSSDRTDVLVADMWRDDEDPYHILHGLMTLDPEAYRVHIYAARNPIGPWRYLFDALRDRGLLGELKGVMKGFSEVLRGADVVVTGSSIATRIVREALALGTPVVGPVQSRFATTTYRSITEIPAAVTNATKSALYPPADPRVFDIGDELIKTYERAIAAHGVPA